MNQNEEVIKIIKAFYDLKHENTEDKIVEEEGIVLFDAKEAVIAELEELLSIIEKDPIFLYYQKGVFSFSYYEETEEPFEGEYIAKGVEDLVNTIFEHKEP